MSEMWTDLSDTVCLSWIYGIYIYGNISLMSLGVSQLENKSDFIFPHGCSNHFEADIQLY